MPQHAMTKKLLVLGSSGKLGRMIRHVWASDPREGITPIYQSRTALCGADTVTWAPGDAYTSLPACDAIIALWGRISGDADSLAENADLAEAARGVARATGASRVLHLSSAAIYGPAVNATEADAPAPQSDYGRAKLAMEARVAGFADDGLHHVCLRLANVVGADSLAPALQRSAPVTLDRFSDGNGPLRSYIGAADLAAVLRALAELSAAHLPTTLNIAAHHPVAMQDLAQAAGKEIIWRDAPPAAVQTVTMNTERLAKLLPHIKPEARAEGLILAWRQYMDVA